MSRSYSTIERSRAKRLRQTAERRRMRLTLSKRRDRFAPDFGQWTVRYPDGTTATAGDLDGVERLLEEPTAPVPT